MDPMTMAAIMQGVTAAGGGLASIFGKSRKAQTTPMVPQEILNRQNQLWDMGMQGMQNPMAGFEPIAAQAKAQFESETVPSLAERFTSWGGGAQRSSAFPSALGRAGAGLSRDLAAMGSQYGLQRMGQLQNLLNMGMGNSSDYYFQPESPGRLQAFGSQLLGQSLQDLPQSISAAYESRYNRRQANSRADKQWEDLKKFLEKMMLQKNQSVDNQPVNTVNTTPEAFQNYTPYNFANPGQGMLNSLYGNFTGGL